MELPKLDLKLKEEYKQRIKDLKRKKRFHRSDLWLIFDIKNTDDSLINGRVLWVAFSESLDEGIIKYSGYGWYVKDS